MFSVPCKKDDRLVCGSQGGSVCYCLYATGPLHLGMQGPPPWLP